MQILAVDEFLSRVISKKYLVIDTRSESEFAHAHIPGAINVPLLNDEHRILIGTCYKKEGRDAAVRLGFKLVGPLFHTFVEKVDCLTPEKEVLVYCWRGGMRSGMMSWILNIVGYKVNILKGGYKGFRNNALSEFKIKRNLGVIGGHTGVGKTELLLGLKARNHQVIDLEGLANHRGSAFGHLGMKPQPSNEQFENELALQLKLTDPQQTIWVEAESRLIGKIKIPDDFFLQFDEAPIYEFILDKEERVKRIEKDYAHFPKEELIKSVDRIKQRLGGLRHQQCIQALEENRTFDWISILLEYYDKLYSHSTDSRSSEKRFVIQMKNGRDLVGSIDQLLQLSKNISCV